MLRFSILLVFCLYTFIVTGQHQSDYWMEVQQDQMSLPADLEPTVSPEQYRLYWLDMDYIRQTLKKAPAEFSRSQKKVRIQLPMPDGTTETFAVEYSPVMEPGLAAKFPMIRSYSAHSIDNPQNTARLVASERGLSVSILTSEGTAYLSPYTLLESTDYHFSYFAQDHKHDEPFLCGTDDDQLIEIDPDHLEASPRSGAGESVDFRTYRFAVSATTDFSRQFGNNVNNILTAFATSVNRLNQIYEKEVAVRMILVDGLEKVIFINGNDPYTNIDEGLVLVGQATGVFNDSIGINNYDLGHIFTGRCTDVGGVAPGRVCSLIKGNGVTCWRNNNIEEMTTQILAHEVGHQFSASHSWNNCPSSADARTGSTAYEPGSGSTIMSYAGLCGNQNTVFNSDDYFHVANLEQIKSFLAGNGGSCANTTPDVNTAPDITLNYTNGFSIPISTPFRLVADASDMDNDPVFYCWEQFDLGPVVDITQPNISVTSTMFRTFEPTANPERIFPRLIDIVNNTSSNAERLPIVSRDITFRCTARDWSDNGGGTDWEEVRFKSTANAGPFLVTQPNSALSWKVGEFREITWDVANTNNSPVNCQTVDIRLSTNGGFTYPIVLAENVPNNGSHFVVIPNEPTLGARVMVMAADNIFFDISNNNFTIEEATEPGIFFSVTPLSQSVCLPGNPTLEIELASLAGYDSLTNLTITGLPDGSVATWANNPALPSEGTSITIDMNEVTVSGAFQIDFTATAPSLMPITRTITLNLISDDFSALIPNAPANGATGISRLPTLEWVEVPNADAYTIEIATSADFNAGSIFQTISNVTGNTYTLDNPLTENTPYYWRIFPINECNTDIVTPTFAFQTESVICLDFTNDDDILISGSGLPVEESPIEVPDGVISDINILSIDLRHDRVRDVKGEIVSPSGTRVLLFDEPCGGTRDIEVGYDDEASQMLICPPTGGASYQPEEMLSAFNGENSQGTWKFVVSVTDNFGNGGLIDSWTLQTCGNLTLDPPILVKNDTLGVPPGMGNDITQDFLLAEDANNTADELTFTLINPPLNGIVRFQGDLTAAGAWSQTNINNGQISYKHNGTDTEFDSFVFSVSDGEGGWIIDTMNIKIDEGFTSSVKNLNAKQYLQIYPVPADQELNVLFLQPFQEETQLNLFDIQGRRLQSHRVGATQATFRLSTQALPSGMYFLQVVTRNGSISQKVSVAR